MKEKKKSKDVVKALKIPEETNISPGEAVYAILDYVTELHDSSEGRRQLNDQRKVINEFLTINGLRIPDKGWHKKFVKPFYETYHF